MSSNACKTVLLPEPESPVRMTSCRGSFRVGGFTGSADQFFSRRWWVLGILMSSRYFATVRRVT